MLIAENMDLLVRSRPKKDRNAMGNICLGGEGIVIRMKNLFIPEMKRFVQSRPLCMEDTRNNTKQWKIYLL